MKYLGLLVTALYLFINAMYAQQAEADSPLSLRSRVVLLSEELSQQTNTDTCSMVTTVMSFII